MGTVRVVSDKNEVIAYRDLHPHYSDGRFSRSAQTVFVAQGHTTVLQHGTEMVDGAHYNYSDRLFEHFHGEQYDGAWEAAKSSGFQKDSAAYIEAFLRNLFKNEDIKLVHIVSGVNHSNGYPYQVYGYFE